MWCGAPMAAAARSASASSASILPFIFCSDAACLGPFEGATPVLSLSASTTVSMSSTASHRSDRFLEDGGTIRGVHRAEVTRTSAPTVRPVFPPAEAGVRDDGCYRRFTKRTSAFAHEPEKVKPARRPVPTSSQQPGGFF